MKQMKSFYFGSLFYPRLLKSSLFWAAEWKNEFILITRVKQFLFSSLPSVYEIENPAVFGKAFWLSLNIFINKINARFMELKKSNLSDLKIVLDTLIRTYRKFVPDMDTIENALIKENVISDFSDIENDHIAFRTLGMPNLGIASLEKIFLYYGYQKRDFFKFEHKKLNAYWYAPPTPDFPRIFISELIIEELTKESREIINYYTSGITADPTAEIDLSVTQKVLDFLQFPLWSIPASTDYKKLLAESEYAAWVIYNRYYLNHFTLSVHNFKEGYNTLVDFNSFLERIGIRLNNSGGKIKISKDGLLLQSSTVAQLVKAVFSDNRELEIAGSYVEFAERKLLPQYADLQKEYTKRKHRRDGFEANNADKIFESTFTSQIAQ